MIVSSRAATAEDESFLCGLIDSQTAAELGAELWPEPMRTHLVGMQRDARRRSIRSNFPSAEDRIIIIDGEPGGWLVIAESRDEIHLVEIIISIAQRGKGAGTELIQLLLSHARGCAKPVRLKVEVRNAGAVRLYERLGFVRYGGDEVRHFMEKLPA